MRVLINSILLGNFRFYLAISLVRYGMRLLQIVDDSSPNSQFHFLRVAWKNYLERGRRDARSVIKRLEDKKAAR